MIVYLVKRADGDWFDFPYGQHGRDPFRPTTIPFRSVGAFDGSYARIEVAGCEVSIEDDMPGIIICFEGAISSEDAQRTAEQIRDRIEEISGQKAELIPLSLS